MFCFSRTEADLNILEVRYWSPFRRRRCLRTRPSRPISSCTLRCWMGC